MRVPRATVPPPDYASIINTIAASISPTAEIETPQLGRVMFHSPADMLASIRTLQMLANEAAGIPSCGVMVCGYNRGLGPYRSFPQ